MAIVDRIENDLAVCEMEDGSFLNIPLSAISGAAKEGDVLIADGEHYRVDEGATELRRQRMRARMHRLFNRQSGDMEE